jgi:hypothetical protein
LAVPKLELKIVLEKGALLETGVNRFVGGGDFQVFGIFNEEINKSALSADSRLEGNLFFDTMIFADNHYQFQVPAGSQTDFSLENAVRAAFATGMGVTHFCPPEVGFPD